MKSGWLKNSLEDSAKRVEQWPEWKKELSRVISESNRQQYVINTYLSRDTQQFDKALDKERQMQYIGNVASGILRHDSAEVNAPVAQRSAQWSYIPTVRGSNPCGSTKMYLDEHGLSEKNIIKDEYNKSDFPKRARKPLAVQRDIDNVIASILTLNNKLRKLKDEYLVSEAIQNGWKLFEVLEQYDNYHNGNPEESKYYVFAGSTMDAINAIKDRRNYGISEFIAKEVPHF